MTRSEVIDVDVNGYNKDSFWIIPHYKKHLDKVLIPGGLIADRVEKLAYDITHFYKGKEVHLICMLKGSQQFFTCLCNSLNKINLFTEEKDQAQILYFTHYVRIKSYEKAATTGKVQIMENTLSELKHKNVLIVEDIIDTGLTMKEFSHWLTENVQPQSIAIATLLKKRDVSSSNAIEANFVGFTVPNFFVVGFGLDYNERFRDLNHICVVDQETL